MNHVPFNATDEELVEVVNEWVRLLEAERYLDAYALTDHVENSGWSPSSIKEYVKAYGEAKPDQVVTFAGTPTDITQRIEVTRWTKNSLGETGEIWYDLNIDGLVSDVTATFAICVVPDGLTLRLCDLHVM